MLKRQTAGRLTPPFVIAWFGVPVFSGCGKEEDPGPGPKPNPGLPTVEGKGGVPEVPAQFAAVRNVFETNCMKCHTTDPNDKGQFPPEIMAMGLVK